MNLPNWLVSLVGVLLVLAVLPFLVLSNVNLFMTPQFVFYEYAKPDFPPSARFDAAARTKFAVATVRYTRGGLNDADLKNLDVYNERELSHMRDVQALATGALALDYVLGALIALAAIVLWIAGSGALAARALFNGAMLTLGIFGAIGLFALVAFNAFFTAFHRVFFVGDSWMFPYTDSLIQFYPQPFWVDAALGLVAFTLLEAVVLAAITFKGARRDAVKRA
jgi:integral membrane protein (TIGR01906 family)